MYRERKMGGVEGRGVSKRKEKHALGYQERRGREPFAKDHREATGTFQERRDFVCPPKMWRVV